jgi:hypothetical protein
MSDVVVVMNPGWEKELAGPDGEVAHILKKAAEPVAQAAREGVGHQTGQLAAAITVEMAEVDGIAEAHVGVTADTDARQGGKATNSQLLRWEEFGNGHEPAKHTMSQALLAGRV